jgi:hypothetical protein
MTHPDNAASGSSVTLSIMLSEAIYRAVVAVERIVQRLSK